MRLLVLLTIWAVTSTKAVKFIEMYIVSLNLVPIQIVSNFVHQTLIKGIHWAILFCYCICKLPEFQSGSQRTIKVINIPLMFLTSITFRLSSLMAVLQFCSGCFFNHFQNMCGFTNRRRRVVRSCEYASRSMSWPSSTCSRNWTIHSATWRQKARSPH